MKITFKKSYLFLIIFSLHFTLQCMENSELDQFDTTIKIPSLNQPCSLKESCCDVLFKNEECSHKIRGFLQKTGMTTKVAHEFAQQVGRRAPLDTLIPIAQELSANVYPDIALELLTHRQEDKEKRQQILEILSNEESALNNEPVMLVLKNLALCFEESKDTNYTPDELFYVAASHPLISAPFLTFLRSKNKVPHEPILEILLSVFEINLPLRVKTFLKAHAADSSDLESKLQRNFYRLKFIHLSSDDTKRAFAMRNALNNGYYTLQKLMSAGLLPSTEGFNFFIEDFDHRSINRKTIFEHCIDQLSYLHTKESFDLEYSSMVLDKTLGLVWDKTTYSHIKNILEFHHKKPENEDISYIETELKDHPFAQKMPLFEHLVKESIDFYRDILLLLMEHSKMI